MTGIPIDHLVESLAVSHHASLGWGGGADAIASGGGRGRRDKGGRGRGGGAGSAAEVDLDAVVEPNGQVAARPHLEGERVLCRGWLALEGTINQMSSSPTPQSRPHFRMTAGQASGSLAYSLAGPSVHCPPYKTPGQTLVPLPS